MKITTNSITLAKHLSIVSSVVKDKPFVPITSNFLFTAESGVLNILGTDNNQDIETSLSVDIKESGICLVPAKDFFNILKSLPSQTVDISTTEKEIVLTTINGKYKFTNEPNIDDFPKRSQEDLTGNLEIDIDLLGKAINHTFNTLPQEETQSNRSGLYIHSDKESNLRFACVSANGGAVALFKSNVKSDINLIISRSSVSLLKNIISNKTLPVTLDYNSNYITFTCDNVKMTCSVLGNSFVNYESIIPESFEAEVHIQRDSFANSIKRVGLLTENEHAAIGLNLNGKVEIIYTDKSYGKGANEIIDYEYCSNEDFSINVKAREFSNMISTLDDTTIKIRFSGNNSVFIIENLETNKEYEAVFYAAPMKPN